MDRWLFSGLGVVVATMAVAVFFPAFLTRNLVELLPNVEMFRGLRPVTLPSTSLHLDPSLLARTAAALPPESVFQKTAPSIWVVHAGDSAKAIRSGTYLQGSAVAITRQQLLTNCHVLKRSHVIILSRNGQSIPAKRFKSDEDNDKCVLQIDDETESLVPTQNIRLAKSLKIGERVITVGAPHGLELTIGEGIIAGIRKYRGLNYIQTTAPISSGSSGGGLFDAEGNLIGITTSMMEDAQGINFAIAAEEFWYSTSK